MLRPALLAALVCSAACVPVDPGGAGPAGIPAAAQGNWGLTAGDCIPGAADAKGLLRVGPTTLRFYESVGTLGEVSARSATAITGMFAFTGEGQTWQRQIRLSVEDGGNVLVRQDDEPGAPAAGYRYTRCD